MGVFYLFQKTNLFFRVSGKCPAVSGKLSGIPGISLPLAADFP